MHNDFQKQIALFLIILVYFIPVQIFRIGTSLGYGIQWPLFRYQDTIIGVSCVSLLNDIGYLLTGTITGRSGISSILFLSSSMILLVSTIALIHSYITGQIIKFRKYSLFLSLSAILYLISIMIQYGLLLSGIAGISIPIGVPLMFFIGWWLHTYGMDFQIPPENQVTKDS
jgi:hypothetical protein